MTTPSTKQIKSLNDLMVAANDRRAVIVPQCFHNRALPAAFIIGMTGRVIHGLISRGMWVYHKRALANEVILHNDTQKP